MQQFAFMTAAKVVDC